MINRASYHGKKAFFASSNDPKGKQRAREMGAVDYIKKPFEKDDLFKTDRENPQKWETFQKYEKIVSLLVIGQLFRQFQE
jgi:CheY-like chemotaxis protein